MYIVAIHTISNPEKFWTAAKTLSVPADIKLHTVFPSTDGAKGMCLWQAESLGAMKQFLEPITSGVASNEYMVVADANAVGLPPLKATMDTDSNLDLGAVKARQQGAWSSADYGVVGTTLQIVGESLCEALDLRAGSSVLDVAAGNGNATLAAARRWCDVTSTDYVPALLESGRRRAQAEGHVVTFQQADAEKLPFADCAFDAVVSTFGVMFTPDQRQAARELARVCKPGGQIGLANWTPDSFVGQLFKLIGQYLPPPAGVRSPALWGTPERLEELFAGTAVRIRVAKREFVFRYRSPLHWIEVFRTYYGPLNRTFAALDTEKQVAFTSDVLALLTKGNRSTDRVLALPSEYLEVVIERR